MSEDDPNSSRHMEVSIGWNSSSPKAHALFPNSLEQSDSAGSDCQRKSPVKLSQQSRATQSGSLGRFSNFLPSSPDQKSFGCSPTSSPLRPLFVEKRQLRSPNLMLAKKQKQDPYTMPKVFVPKPLAPPKISPTSENDAFVFPDDEDEDDFDFDIEELGPKVEYKPSFFNSRKVRRFVVQKFSSIKSSSGDSFLDLTCLSADGKTQNVQLKGSWAKTALVKGDVLHLISSKPSLCLVVEDLVGPKAKMEDQLLAVVNPDILVPCTSVADSMSCERQVVLRNQVRVPADLNENLVLGSIKHEFIQACFVKNNFSTASLQEELQRACEMLAIDLQLVNLDTETAFNKLEPVILHIQKWSEQIWGDKASGTDIYGRANTSYRVRINRAAEIEEEIRSPFYGLVGKIDVSVEVRLTQPGGKIVTRMAGLEIKTGKYTKSMSHRTQSALYTLLMAERYPNNTHPWTLLYYTETGATTAVSLTPLELAALIQKRNSVVHQIWNTHPSRLPVPVSASDAICKWCSRQDSCVLYTAINDKGNTHDQSALEMVYKVAAESGKLTPKLLLFIEHWHHLLDLEYETDRRNEQLRLRQWWLNEVDPVLWKVCAKHELESGSETTGNHYTLKPEDLSVDVEQLTLPNMDSIVMFSTKQQMAAKLGYIVAVEKSGIRVNVRQEMQPFGRYRIDIDPWGTEAHLGLAKFNLNQLLSNDRLKELIVDLVPPKFATFSKDVLESSVKRMSNRVLTQTESEPLSLDTLYEKETTLNKDGNKESDEAKELMKHSNFNEDQIAAVTRVLSARDYALILGMPGTGKTTTIAAIVAALVERGKTVLVSAYTNSAVNTIVLKLLEARQNCLRLVSSNMDLKTMDPKVAAVSVSVRGTLNDGAGGAQLVEFLNAPVVACTSHSTNNKLYALRQFDYCILDEASQITLPFCIGPLRLASIFVLVGDHYQLPPLVRNSEARQKGMDQSLFKILCENHPSSVVELTKQYRMCRDIMSLSSELVYDGKLVCGTEAVANQKLDIPKWSNSEHNSSIYRVLDPKNCVAFLDTDPLGSDAYEISHNNGSSNSTEATILKKLTMHLHDMDVSMSEIAVISVYRQQLLLLSQLLQDYCAKGLEILTADQAQGRDKSCILVSLVRSNDASQAGELLKDWRRLNVVFTRAKKKLVIVGSKRTMQQADGVARFFKHIDSNGWVHSVDLDALS